MPETVIGAYGPRAAGIIPDEPANLSLRRERGGNLDAWREMARGRLAECLAAPDSGGVPAARARAGYEYDGLHGEELSWQLPYGPPTEAVFR